MCLVRPQNLSGQKWRSWPIWLIIYLKNTLFYLRCLYDTESKFWVFRKYNISEEKNYQMFSYMLNFLVCVW